MLEKPGDVVCVITLLPPTVASSVTVGHCQKQDIDLDAHYPRPQSWCLRGGTRVNLLKISDGGRGWNHDSGL